MIQVGGVETWYSQDPQPQVNNPKQEEYYNCRGLTQGVRCLSPYWAPWHKGLAQGKWDPRMTLMTSRVFVQESQRAIGNRDLMLKRHMQILTHWVPAQRQWSERTHLSILESLQRQEATGTSPGDTAGLEHLLHHRTLVWASTILVLPSSLLVLGAYLLTSRLHKTWAPTPRHSQNTPGSSPSYQQARTSPKPPRQYRKLCKDQALTSSRCAPAPNCPRPHIQCRNVTLLSCGPAPTLSSFRPQSQLCRKPTPSSSRLTATWCIALQSNKRGRYHYHNTNSSWPCQNRRAHAGHTGSTLRTYSSRDQSRACCWAPQDICYIRLLLQDWET